MVEWEEYYKFEPWGAPAEDDRWRVHYMLQWRAHAFTGMEPVWLDRDPEETARIKAEEAARLSLADKIDAYFSSRCEEAQA